MDASDVKIYALQPPAPSDLLDWGITVPGTFVGPWLDTLAGMEHVAIQARFMFGSSADSTPTVHAYVQSSMDQGQTGYDLWRFEFGKLSDWKLTSVSQPDTGGPEVTPTDGGSDPNGTQLPLGDRLRLKVVVTGNWTNTTLAVRVLPS